MFYNFRRTNTILQQLKITPNQAWLCIMFMERDYNYKLDIYNKYIQEHGGISILDLEQLEELGYVENFSNSKVDKTVQRKKINFANNKYDVETVKSRDANILDLFLVTPKFIEQVYVDNELAAEELLKVYPAWGKIKGTNVPLKKITDRESFYEYYGTIINGDMLKHKYILDMFSNYKTLLLKNKVACMTVKNALESRLWLDIEELIQLEEANKDVGESL